MHRFLVVLFKLLGVAFLFLGQVLPAFYMEVEEYGWYASILSLAMICVVISNFGGDRFFLKEVAKSDTAKGFSGFFWVVFKCVSINFILVSAFLLYEYKNNLGLFLFVVASVLINVVFMMFSSFMRGVGKRLHAEFLQNAFRPFLFFIMMFAFFYFKDFDGVIAESLVVFLMLSWGVGVLIQVYVCRSSLKVYGAEALGKETRGVYASYKTLVPFAMLAVGPGLMNQIDIYMVSKVIGVSEAGGYSIASKASNLLSLSSVALNLYMAPVIARMFKDASSRNKGLKEIKTTMFLVTVLTIAPAILIIAYSVEALEFVKPEYAASSSLLEILVVSKVISALCGPVFIFLAMAGDARFAGIASVLALVILGSSIYIISPGYGVQSVAYLQLLVVGGLNLTLLARIISKYKVDVSVFCLLRKSA